MTGKDRKPVATESDAGNATEHKAQASFPEQTLYEIKVKGYLDSHWSEWFGGLTMAYDKSGHTTLSGPVADQAALHGLLNKIGDMNLPLISVKRINPIPEEENPLPQHE